MDQLKIKMRQPHGKKLLQSLASDWQIYVLLLPVVIWFALWAYKPMGGLLICAFLTMRMMRAKVVSSPSRLTLSTKTPERLMVPPVTLSPTSRLTAKG